MIRSIIEFVIGMIPFILNLLVLLGASYVIAYMLYKYDRNNEIKVLKKEITILKEELEKQKYIASIKSK